jgi:two-component system, NarL family, nitrate/nitrite response regulator NarL
MPNPTPKPIRLLIIDDHALVRTGLRLLLESHPGLAVVGEAGNRPDALAAVREQPDIVLLDLDLGGRSGLDFLPDLFVAAPRTRVLILTGVLDPDLHRQAVRLGAVGLVLKERAAEVLLQAIEKVHAGEVWLEQSMIASVLGQMTRAERQPEDPEQAKIATLTARERQVIALVGEGLRSRQIAERLHISETTVTHHLTSIFNKLELLDRLKLLVYAYRHGLARPLPNPPSS